MLTSAVKDGTGSGTLRRRGGVAEPMLWVALAAVLAYAGTLAYGFVWDDHALIGYRAHLFTLARVPDLLGSEFFAFTPQRTHYWRPFITASYLWDHFVWGLRPLGFHLTNLAAHTAVSLTVFGLGSRLGRRQAVGVAAGLLFALHPVHGEAVAFVSGRTDLFAALFSLGALLAHGRARTHGPSAGRWGWTMLSAFCFALGLFSKETVVLLPLLLVSLDWAESDGPIPWRPLLSAMAPQAAVLAVYLVLRGTVLGRMVIAVETPWADLPTRFLATIKLAALYGQVALLPAPERIWWVVPKEGFPPSGGWWLAAAWLTLLLALTGYACLRSRRVGFGCLWFWITLAPAVGVNLLPVAKEVAAERFLYLPTVGVCLLAGLGLGRLGDFLDTRGSAQRRLARTLGVAALAALGTWAWSRTLAWRDDHRLALRMVETSPEARLPRQNLGLSFLKRGDYAQARIHLEKAVALGSASLPLQGTLGVVEATLGQRDQGLARALKAAHSDPGDPTLAALVADVHRVRGEQAEALAWLEKGLSLNPGSVEMRLNRAGALIALDRLDEAGAALRETEARLPAAGNTRLTFARLQADLESRRDPAAAAGRWARLVVELRALPERTSAQSLDLAYAERKLAEGARAPRR